MDLVYIETAVTENNKAKSLFSQEQMAKQQAQTHITKDWLNSIEKDEEELRAKVQHLEMYLNNVAPNSLKELQVNLKTQLIHCQTVNLILFPSHLNIYIVFFP